MSKINFQYKPNVKNHFVLSIISGILLSLPWYQLSGITIFIAFIPLLYIERYYFLNKGKLPCVKLFIYTSLAFLTWNILTTWWIGKATIIGLIAAITVNTFLMSFVFYLFHILSKYFINFRYIILIVLWLSFEYIYFRTDISWPWLTLGYALAKNIKIIQWYDITGVLGGSLWILIINVLIFKIAITDYYFLINRQFIFCLILFFIILSIPISYSYYKYFNYHEKQNSHEIAIIQPNIDPYLSVTDQNLNRLELFGGLLKETVNSSTDFVVGPEAYIKKPVKENNLLSNSSILYFQNLIKSYSDLEIVCGFKSYRIFNQNENISETAREINNSGYFKEKYNSLIYLNNSEIQIRHKSKLVLGVEKMPYSGKLLLLEKLFQKFGGIFYSLGVDEKPVLFHSFKHNLKIAALVCYESVYGEYVAEFIKDGAEFIFLSTNDGWWGNTPGYKQHLSFSQVRTIETRRSMARSANTGISCFINQRGEIQKSIQFWEKGVIIDKIFTNSKITFYVNHGDYIGRICLILSIFFLIFFIVLYKLKFLKSII
ncbi:MAG: apolipoprotein N-acyltransferase [Bacteroidales bacterium]|nr:apolipoprotein N-acyltransferase [Bacteroidales bacterium]